MMLTFNEELWFANLLRQVRLFSKRQIIFLCSERCFSCYMNLFVFAASGQKAGTCFTYHPNASNKNKLQILLCWCCLHQLISSSICIYATVNICGHWLWSTDRRSGANISSAPFKWNLCENDFVSLIERIKGLIERIKYLGRYCNRQLSFCMWHKIGHFVIIHCG